MAMRHFLDLGPHLRLLVDGTDMVARRSGPRSLGVRLLAEPMACPSAPSCPPSPPVSGGQGRAKPVPQGREDRRRSAAEPRTGAPLTADHRRGTRAQR
jgi:hypothetical protein